MSVAPNESVAREDILLRCRAPTDWLCRCGTVARALRRHGVAHRQQRVALRRRHRDDVEAVSGQGHVPVLILDGQPICDSHRILEHLDWRASQPGSG